MSAHWWLIFTATCWQAESFITRLTAKDRRTPRGKLRLTYEAAPLAFLVEQAGGHALQRRSRISWTSNPNLCTSATPLFIGNRDLVMKAEEFIRQYDRFTFELDTCRTDVGFADRCAKEKK